MYVRVGAVTGLLDATYRGPYCVLEEEAAPGDRCHTAVGLRGLPEAAYSASGPAVVQPPPPGRLHKKADI